MSVRLIYDRIEHHAAHSGYDQLAKHVAARPLENGMLFRLTARIGSRRLARMKASQTPWYSRDALRREIAVCARSTLLPARTLFHWLYGENDVRVSPLWRWRWNNRFVASFHQPPEFLDGLLADKSFLRGLDGVIVMAAAQIPYMSRFTPRERVHHVPHGVDTDYWAPDAAVARHENPTFLFVGSWLRDVEMTRQTIARCGERGLSARFRIVARPDMVEQFATLPHTTVLTQIPDDALRDEFRRAHALFLPLVMSTSNNSILEAMACGTAVISTNVGGTPEYVPPGCGTLVAGGDVAAATAAIERACRERNGVEEMGRASRARAMNYSWPKVGALQEAVYRRILGGR